MGPSALAVLRLMTNWNGVGCSMGRSAGRMPLRILSTYVAARGTWPDKSARTTQDRPPGPTPGTGRGREPTFRGQLDDAGSVSEQRAIRP